jgi:hypothetical protein
MNATLVKDVVLPDVNSSDYGGVWWTHMQAPYVFVAGGTAGLFVVDISNPTSPSIPKRLSNADLGITRINQVHVIGNMMLVNYSENGTGSAFLDISDPVNPRVTANDDNNPPTPYSTLFNGGRWYSAGKQSQKLGAWTIQFDADKHPSGMVRYGTDTGSGTSGGGYLSVQSGFVFGGFSNSWAKFDTRTLPMTMLDSDPGTSGAQPWTCRRPTTATSISAPCSATWSWPATTTATAAPDGAPGGEGPDRPHGQLRQPPRQLRQPEREVARRPHLHRSGGARDPQHHQHPGSPGRRRGPGRQVQHPGWRGELLSQLAAGRQHHLRGGGRGGRVKDWVGNPVPTEFISRFSTGASIITQPTQCNLGNDVPGTVGTAVAFTATGCAGTGLQYSWNFGDGSAATAFSTSANASRTYTTASTST